MFVYSCIGKKDRRKGRHSAILMLDYEFFILRLFKVNRDKLVDYAFYRSGNSIFNLPKGKAKKENFLIKKLLSDYHAHLLTTKRRAQRFCHSTLEDPETRQLLVAFLIELMRFLIG